MTKVGDLTNIDTEKLLEAQDALKTDGGKVLVQMMNEGMNVFMNRVMNTEEGAERNRGRCDVYAGFVKLPSQIADELSERRKES